MPNPEVKPFSADGTAWGTAWESRTPPDIFALRAATVLVAALSASAGVLLAYLRAGLGGLGGWRWPGTGAGVGTAVRPAGPTRVTARPGRAAGTAGAAAGPAGTRLAGTRLARAGLAAAQARRGGALARPAAAAAAPPRATAPRAATAAPPRPPTREPPP